MNKWCTLYIHSNITAGPNNNLSIQERLFHTFYQQALVHCKCYRPHHANVCWLALMGHDSNNTSLLKIQWLTFYFTPLHLSTTTIDQVSYSISPQRMNHFLLKGNTKSHLCACFWCQKKGKGKRIFQCLGLLYLTNTHLKKKILKYISHEGHLAWRGSRYEDCLIQATHTMFNCHNNVFRLP